MLLYIKRPKRKGLSKHKRILFGYLFFLTEKQVFSHRILLELSKFWENPKLLFILIEIVLHNKSAEIWKKRN